MKSPDTIITAITPSHSFSIAITRAFHIARKKILHNHKINESSYNIAIINSIIYNEKAHIVAAFKDFLIWDDSSEFLKRFYKNFESRPKLPRIFEFYETYSKIFANYINLPEAKYMYKNIQRKQKMINNLQQTNVNNNSSLDEEKPDTKIFNTEVCDSILSHASENKIDREEDIDKNTEENSIFDLEKLIATIDKIEKHKTNANEMMFNTLNNSQQNSDDREKFSSYFSNRRKMKENLMKIVQMRNVQINNSNKIKYSSGRKKFPGSEVNTIVFKEKSKEKDNLKMNCIQMPKKLNPLTYKHEKTIHSNRGEKQKTDNKNYPNEIKTERQRVSILSSNPNSNHNTILVSSTIATGNQTSHSPNHRTIPVNNFIDNSNLTKPCFQKEKIGNASSSVQRLTNNIFNNFNIINNIQATTIPHSTQINIYNNVEVTPDMLAKLVSREEGEGVMMNMDPGLIVNAYCNLSNHIRQKSVSTAANDFLLGVGLGKEMSRGKLVTNIKTASKVVSNIINDSKKVARNKVNIKRVRVGKSRTVNNSMNKHTHEIIQGQEQEIILSKNVNAKPHDATTCNSTVANLGGCISNIKNSQLKKSMRAVIHRDLFERRDNYLSLEKIRGGENLKDRQTNKCSYHVKNSSQVICSTDRQYMEPTSRLLNNILSHKETDATTTVQTVKKSNRNTLESCKTKGGMMHRPAKSNFFTGSEIHKLTKNCGAFSKIPEIARKLKGTRDHSGAIRAKETLTSDNQIELKIKKFFDVVKTNVMVPSAISARVLSTNRTEKKISVSNKKIIDRK